MEAIMEQANTEQSITEQPFQTLEATWSKALLIWWWVTWRAMLIALAGGFLLGAIVGMIAALAKIDPKSIQLISGIMGFTFGTVAYIFTIKLVLNRKFKGFSLLLFKTD